MATSELTFLHGQSVPRCTHDVDKFFTGYQTLQFMSAGAIELSVGPDRRRLEGRWFWSAYPGPRVKFHVARPFASWTHRYIAFQGPLAARWVAEGLFPVPPQAPPGDFDFGPRFDEMLAAARRTDRWGPRRAVHLLEGLLLELAEARASAPAHGQWLATATAKLAGSIDGALPDYSALAAELGMGETTLRRRFRKATGTSPHGYVLQCRLAEARRLLGETDIPVKAVAERLGYRDVYFFSRQFRQLAGVPPTVYRASRQ